MLGSTLMGKPGNSGEKSPSAAQYSLHTNCCAHWAWGSGRADTGICSSPASSQCLKEDSPAWSAPRIGGHRGGRCPITFLGRSVISEMPEERGAQADMMQKHTTHDNMKGGATQKWRSGGRQEVVRLFQEGSRKWRGPDSLESEFSEKPVTLR